MKITIQALTQKIASLKKNKYLLLYPPEFVDGLIDAYQDVSDCLEKSGSKQTFFDGITGCTLCGHELLEEEISYSMTRIESVKRCPACNLKIEERISKHEHEVSFIDPDWSEQKLRKRFLQLWLSLGDQND